MSRRTLYRMSSVDDYDDIATQRIWGVDLYTDHWIRVVVEDIPSFERASGTEPQFFQVTDVIVMENSGDPGNLHLTFSQDLIIEIDEWAGEDIDFFDWYGNHEEEFIFTVKKVFIDKAMACLDALLDIDSLQKEVCHVDSSSPAAGSDKDH